MGFTGDFCGDCMMICSGNFTKEMMIFHGDVMLYFHGIFMECWFLTPSGVISSMGGKSPKMAFIAGKSVEPIVSMAIPGP